MNEIIFLVEEAPEEGYIARALGESIFTGADDLENLHEQVRDPFFVISMKVKRSLSFA